MLGIMNKFLSFKNKTRLFFTIILNSILFSLLHFQYRTFGDYSTIFFQSINFALTYLSLGIIPTFVTHLLWNYYFPNIIPQLPILILTIGLPLYDNYKENRIERMKRIVHPR
jgi:membrane protease YdiL (CAAX protease family)